MTDRDFNELAGRIEGLSRLVLNMAAMLEEASIIDGPRLCAVLRSDSKLLEGSTGKHMETAQLVLQQLADQLESGRSFRQSMGGPAGNQGR